MNGVVDTTVPRGLPAITVLRLAAQSPVPRRERGSAAADAALLAAVRCPPRMGGVRAVGTLLPSVLARYGMQVAAAEQQPASDELTQAAATL